MRNTPSPTQRVVVCICAAIFLLLFSIPGQAQQNMLTRHVREATINGQAKLVGTLPPSQVLQLDVVLPLRDQAGLDAFLAELYDPTSPTYRQFLTVAQFTEMFGPTQRDYDAVIAYAQAHGLAVVGGSRDGMEVQVKGTVLAIESAFHLLLQTYDDPVQDRVFYAPDREPSADLPFQLWHISGLDNYSIPHPMYVKKSDYAKAHGLDPNHISNATTGSGPSASFLGSDMRAAYYGGTALTGSGQNLGLFEYVGTDLADLTTYFKNVSQTNSVPITLLSTDGTSTSCTEASGKCDDTEQTLDMTQAIGMAPGLASLVNYIGSTDTAIISAMTTHSPLPTTIGCSWGWTPADPSTLDPYFQKMAAQGQNFFAASGDSSTWSSSNEAWPADDANVVSVGGTDLTTSSAAGPWKSETAWVDSGGGISPDSIPIPSYQQLSGVINSSNKGSTTLRNGPDVSANANFSFYVCADQTTCTANSYGGTSFAAPMWAGYIALVNQQLVANGKSTIGFINPSVYAIGVSSSYGTDFHDITSGTSGSYSAVTGYDLVTGWGSPNGANLINALAGSSSPSFTLSDSPTSLSIAQGSNGTSTITVTPSGGFTGSVTLAASGLPSGVTAAFGTNPTTSTSVLTLTASSGATTGTSTVTITGTSGSLTATTTLALTITATGTPSFTLSDSPTSLSITQGGAGGTSTVTVTDKNGFSGSVTLAASGLPSGVTAAFGTNPTTSTSVLTLTASSTATTGTSTVTITGTSGSLTATTTLALTVTAATSSTEVSLSSYFNWPGIYTDGSTFSSGGGLDGYGDAYSANLLGTSQTWNGVPFALGAANANNEVYGTGQTLTLPSGKFSTLRMLAAGTNGAQTSQKFVVTYTNGTTTTFTQSLSDWATSSGYSGESKVATMAYVDEYNGTKYTVTVYLYGYSFAINNTLTVKSVKLPNNDNVNVMALTLVP
jgi:subtilase family serine protease